jgi:hypothetical protein
LKPVSIPVIAGLAVGIGMIMLFATLKMPEQVSLIPTVPRVSEEQAAQIVIEDIQSYSPNTKRNDIHLYSSEGYLAIDRFFKEGKHLPLFYYHPITATRFFINSTDNSIISACPERICDAKPELIGKLVYGFDMDCGEGCGVGAYYVDAIKGEVAYTNLPGPKRPEMLPPPVV